MYYGGVSAWRTESVSRGVERQVRAVQAQLCRPGRLRATQQDAGALLLIGSSLLTLSSLSSKVVSTLPADLLGSSVVDRVGQKVGSQTHDRNSVKS